MPTTLVDVTMACAGQPFANVLEGNARDYPLLFFEKQIIAVRIAEAHLIEGDRYGIPFSYCEVYAPRELMTNVCPMHCIVSLLVLTCLYPQLPDYFHGPFESGFERIEDDVVSIVVPYMPNYYHWIAEGVTLFDEAKTYRFFVFTYVLAGYCCRMSISL